MLELHRASVEEFRHGRKSPLAVVLDNVRSLNNIGSIFRSSDAFAVSEIALCGITATPPSPEIHKTALGAEDSVEWTYYPTTLEALDALKAKSYVMVAVEQCHGSVSLEQFAPKPGQKYALILGNEVYGVDQKVVDCADICVEIPQLGTKHSLNVAVTGGILLWHMVEKMF